MAMTRGTITIAGFVGNDPVKRGTQELPVMSFRLGSNRRRFNKATQQWEDYPTTWVTVKAFRNLAENAHSSLQRGDSVLVTGMLTTEQWVTDQGEERTRNVIEASNIGHDMNFGTTRLKKVTRVRSGKSANESAASLSGVAVMDEPTSLAGDITSDNEDDDIVGSTVSADALADDAAEF